MRILIWSVQKSSSDIVTGHDSLTILIDALGMYVVEKLLCRAYF